MIERPSTFAEFRQRYCHLLTTRQAMVACGFYKGHGTPAIARHLHTSHANVLKLAEEVAAIVGFPLERKERHWKESSKRSISTRQAREDDLDAAALVVCAYCKMRFHTVENCEARNQDRARSTIGSALGHVLG